VRLLLVAALAPGPGKVLTPAKALPMTLVVEETEQLDMLALALQAERKSP